MTRSGTRRRRMSGTRTRRTREEVRGEGGGEGERR